MFLAPPALGNREQGASTVPSPGYELSEAGPGWASPSSVCACPALGLVGPDNRKVQLQSVAESVSQPLRTSVNLGWLCWMSRSSICSSSCSSYVCAVHGSAGRTRVYRTEIANTISYVRDVRESSSSLSALSPCLDPYAGTGLEAIAEECWVCNHGDDNCPHAGRDSPVAAAPRWPRRQAEGWKVSLLSCPVLAWPGQESGCLLLNSEWLAAHPRPCPALPCPALSWL